MKSVESKPKSKLLMHMTQIYTVFIFLLFGGYGNANEYLPIINVAEKWSASHNDKSINSLQLLYANKLNYYSSDFSRKKVLTDKKIFLNKYPHFSHNIENIEVSYIGMEQYLVKFDKYVKLNLSDSDKVYPSYLVVKNFGGKYKIIVEGDQITDSNLDGEVRSKGLYKVRSNVLNVRKEPHKYSVILNTMKKNELIYIDVFIGKWGKSNNGWLSSKYLQLAETIDSDIGKNNAKKDTVLLSEEYSNMKVPAVYEVRIGKLNIRDAPGKSGKVLEIIELGDRVNIYEFNGKWGRSDRGWISGKHLKFKESTRLSNNDNDNETVENNDTKMEMNQWYYWVAIIIVFYFVFKILVKIIKRKIKRREIAEKERIKRIERKRVKEEKAEEIRKREKTKKDKIEYLLSKYGKQEIVDNIMNKQLWLAETKEQIIESMGEPLDIDTNVTKTKRKETWKYHRSGKNRYNLRIYIENGIIVGWEDK